MESKEPISNNEETEGTPIVLYLFIGVLVACIIYIVGMLIFTK